MERNDRHCARLLGKSRGIRHIHIVADAVDGQEKYVDIAPRVREAVEDSAVIERVARDVIDLIFDGILDDNAYRVGVAVCGADSGEDEAFERNALGGFFFGYRKSET